ncbi:MAG: hypothetical protein IJS99_06775, partial [Synergistaceae bacterium]|nr:hypothetical protein [Synergistaceae bacterium]
NFARYNSGIIITNSAYKDLNAVNFNIDFSLHEDFAEMKSFIKQLNPKQAIIVHCGGKSNNAANNATIEDEIMKDSECRTQFIFAEDKQLYIL